MEGNWHLNKSAGIKAECHATERTCPLEHFKSEEEADRALNEFLDSKYGVGGVSFSDSNPNTSESFLGRCEDMGGYVGVEVPATAVEAHQRTMEEYLGPKDYGRYANNRILRSGNKFHVTVLSPKEFRQLKKQGFDPKILKRSFRFTMKGVGTATDGTNTTMFVVAESEGAQSFRKSLGLDRHDFHVTLGFADKDVHGVPKDKTTLL